MIDTRAASPRRQAGGWLPHSDPAPHTALGNRRISHVAGGLWLDLRAMLLTLDPTAAEHDPTAGACDLLRLLALTARPTAAGGYLTDPVADLGHRPVRLRPDGTGALMADQP